MAGGTREALVNELATCCCCGGIESTGTSLPQSHDNWLACLGDRQGRTKGTAAGDSGVAESGDEGTNGTTFGESVGGERGGEQESDHESLC